MSFENYFVAATVNSPTKSCFLVLWLLVTEGYGDSVGKTVKQHIAPIQSCCQQRYAGSTTLLQENAAVLNWGC